MSIILLKTQQNQSIIPPPEVESPNQISVPLEKLLRLRLSDKVIAGLSNIPHYQIRDLRDALIKEGDFIQNVFVQKRALDRNSMNRFVLFLADCFFDLQIQLGLEPVHAFIKTVETLECAPTYQANKSDDFHLSVNLYYWLCLQNKLPYYECRVTRPVEESHFPDSFLAFYEFNSQALLPPIREMGGFPIPHCLDHEHQRVLNAINNAIPCRASLRKVLINYFGGQYK